ncbi:MAG: response regulator [Saprospiraceae bacterium]|nr:response regulator [Saprospiraceae bacterium]
MNFPVPINESERLKALKKYNILDTLPEDEFNNLTELASHITGSPIALITLLDETRQWFKSRVGLGVGETSREVSFCQYAIMDTKLFEVYDAWEDDRFRDNILVTGSPNIRFYAGYPLETSEGYNLGTICVIDDKPKALNKGQREMMKRLAETTIALIEARLTNKQLENVIKYKNQFLSNVSHEIRTPMNSIIGFTDLLKQTPVSSEQLNYLQIISSAASNLLVVINDILDLSKNETKPLRLKATKISLTKLIEGAVSLSQLQADGKGLGLYYSVDKTIPEFVMGDGPRLTQILINLIGNALKFTEKGQVDVDLTVLNQTATHVKVQMSVKDTGKGIASHDLDKIFDRFEQGDADKVNKLEGTGLGLSIVKMLSKLHNGRVWATSTLGKGSTFFCTIEFLKFVPEPSELEKHSNEKMLLPIKLKNLRVLVVEDNILNQKLAGLALNKLEVDATIASNGLNAIQLLKEAEFDVILMDLEMPVMNGFEATKVIREELNISTPIIACTAHVMAEEKQKCLEQGMNGFITKPYKQDALEAALIEAYPD